jgi:hypothetical protein
MSSMCLEADMNISFAEKLMLKMSGIRSNEETNKEAEIPLPFARHLHGQEYSLKLRLATKQLSRLFSGGEGGIRTHGTREGSTVFETARFNHSRTSPRT